MKKLLTAILALGAAVNFAAANLYITEAYTGVSGNDGTPDWFEISNYGVADASLAGLYYDDDSANPANNYALPAFTLTPGESAIVLIESNANQIPGFYAFWGLSPADVQVGVTGGGSLGQGGDAVWVFQGNTAGAPVVDSLIFPGSLAGLNGTIEDNSGVGPLTNSVLGVNGAFQSIGGTGIGLLIGSPGITPEPASLALLGIGGLLAIRRR